METWRFLVWLAAQLKTKAEFGCGPHRSLGLMYFTYGVVFACGCSFSYQPSLVILGHYFKKRLGLVNGIVTAGSSVFTILMPYLLSGLLSSLGFQNTLRVLCTLIFVLILAGFSYRPLLPPKPKSSQSGQSRLRQVFNTNIWKSVGYRIWAFGIPAALYGYFVPYVHLVSLSFQYILGGVEEVWKDVLLTVKQDVYAHESESQNAEGFWQDRSVSLKLCSIVLLTFKKHSLNLTLACITWKFWLGAFALWHHLS